MTTGLGVPAQHLLDVIVACYGADGVPDGQALPTRRYIGFGQPGSIAADEPNPTDPQGSLMVAPQRVDTDIRGGTGVGRGSVTTHRGSIQVRLLRPVAWFTNDGGIPTPERVTADSLRLADDQALVVEALHQWADLLKRTPETAFLEVAWGPVDAISPSGGLAGNRVTAALGPL